MRERRLAGLLLITTLLLACNFPLLAPATQTAAPASATSTNTAASIPAATATVTLTPTLALSPTPTLVPTPSVPMVTPYSVNVNCRSGPDVAYDAVGALLFGSSAEVTGRLEDSSWWYVRNPSNPSGFCWIAASVVTISGPTAGIPVVAPPAPIVTKVTVGVSVPSTVYCGGPNPVSFSGTITTNGNTTVSYQWEITGDKTNTTSPETLSFSSAGTKDAADPGAYNVDCGKYTITLHVLSPNGSSAKKNFTVAP